MWGDREVTDLAGDVTTEKAFSRDLRVQFTPTLLMLDDSGEVALRINGYFPPQRFETALDWFVERDQQSFADYLAARQPQAASGELHGGEGFLDASRLDQRERDKPLLVFFEQRQCSACDELHGDILQRAESRELLENFERAVVDIWSKETLTTPDGRQKAAREWARELGVQYAPSLVFFDADGREIFRSEAYLRAFHIQSMLDYVASGAWREQPEFQRFVDARAEALREAGVEVDLMK
jgi:thioredoxin-related protein